MRKLMTLFLVVGLLAVAAPAMAQTPPGANPGSLDTHSLITSGAVLPYVGGGANASFLEAYAPHSGGVFHMFFFDPSCVRVGDSAQIDLTVNDVEFRRVDNLGNTPPAGLLTGGGVDSSGFFLTPEPTPVHLRMLWVNAAEDFIRVLEPIALSTLDNDVFGGVGTWNNLRTGAAFWLPLEGAGFRSVAVLHLPEHQHHRDGGRRHARLRDRRGLPAAHPGGPGWPGRPRPSCSGCTTTRRTSSATSGSSATASARFGATELSSVYAECPARSVRHLHRGDGRHAVRPGVRCARRRRP